MHTVKYISWQEGEDWIGYLENYPDYWTQGETLNDLIEHLKDLYLDMTSGQIPGNPREEIVLGFQPADVRPLTDFAVG